MAVFRIEKVDERSQAPGNTIIDGPDPPEIHRTEFEPIRDDQVTGGGSLLDDGIDEWIRTAVTEGELNIVFDTLDLTGPN